MPKKGSKKKKSAKPAWMSDEHWALSQNAIQLAEVMKGQTLDLPGPPVTRVQAAIWLRQLCSPSKNGSKRDEAIQNGVVEVCVKMLKDDSLESATTRGVAAGLLADLAQMDAGRDLLLGMRPTPLMWNCILKGSTAVRDGAFGCLKQLMLLAGGKDPNVEFRRALTKFLCAQSWEPLVDALTQADTMPLCGGKQVSLACASFLATLAGPPPPEALGGLPVDRTYRDRVHECLLAAKALEVMIQLSASMEVLPEVRDCCVSILWHLMSRGPVAVHDDFIRKGGIQCAMAVMGDKTLGLPTRAAAAGCLRVAMSPCKERAAALARARAELETREAAQLPPDVYSTLRPRSAFTPAYRQAPPKTAPGEYSDDPEGLVPAIRGLDSASMRPLSVQINLTPRPNSTAGSAGFGGLGPAGPITVTQTGDGWAGFLGTISESGHARPMDEFAGTGATAMMEMLELDEALREYTLQRAALVAGAGAVPLLVELAAPPEGPLPDKEGQPAEEVAGAGGKKKKGKGKKGKKAPMLPGMEEAQVNATSCLRIFSLDDEMREMMMRAGVVRYLAPLLMVKQDRQRWHARNILLSLAQNPQYRKVMELYEVPNFVTNANVPAVVVRPSTAPSSLYGSLHPLAQAAQAVREGFGGRRRHGSGRKGAGGQAEGGGPAGQATSKAPTRRSSQAVLDQTRGGHAGATPMPQPIAA
ncbi:unnamed protein product [Pedinophyceae sp. YPF-701]|nr:unnamed protein product [Pedinophyceae sp. YPF-701]